MPKRVVDVEFWTDEKVELYTPEEKYFWLFLLTNPFTTQCGIYHVTLKQMSFYLGYDTETCKKLLERFEKDYKVIKFIDNELAIKNYLQHSIVKGGMPIEQQIDRELKSIRNKQLINWVFENLSNKEETLTQTIINILNNKDKYINNANANACTDERTLERTQKHQYGTYNNVLLTDKELETLKQEFPNDWQNRIERVSEYCASKGKAYKNYLATIRMWDRKDNKQYISKMEDKLPTYDPSLNKDMNEKDKQELLRLMGKEL